MPGAIAPRIMVWAAAIATVPLTGGATLAGIALYEGGIAIERKRAASEIDRNGSLEKDAEVIAEGIGYGENNISVKSKHNLGHLGLGHVTRELIFKNEEYS